MTRPLNLFVLLAAVLLLASPAVAENAKEAIPPKAIGNSTMLAAYVDVTQIDPEMIEQLGNVFLGLADNEMLKDQGLALPLGDAQEMVDALTTLRGSFLQAGGEGLAMTVEMPGEETWSAPMMLLAKTNDKFDAKSMTAMVRSMGEGEMDATIEAIGSGWQNIAMKTKQGEAVTLAPPKPDAEVFDALNKQLSQQDKPMLALAFRMQDEMRQMLDGAEEMAKGAQAGPGVEGQDPQAQMMMGMLMGMFKPIRELDTIGLSISKVGEDSMLVDAQMTFLDATSAQQFANVYNMVMMFAPVAMAQMGQGGEVENMPDPATINQFFMKLRMEVAGESLKLKLDQDFFDLVEKMAPLFEGIQGEAGGAGLNL